MKSITHFWRALLIIVVPVLFAVISSIIIAAIFSFVGVLMGHNTFVNCFQHMLGDVTFVMSIVTVVVWIVYLVTDPDV
jgi:hypothetical protein